MMKIVGTTQSCETCPNKRYRSAGRHECAVVGLGIHDTSVIAPFCPLADYPAATIAGMEQTIARLRAPYQYGLRLAMLNHVATKLNANLGPDGGGIRIRCKDGANEREVRFDVRCVTGFDIRANAITFIDGDDAYRLDADASPPRLELLVRMEGKDLYRGLTIQ